MSGKIRTNDTTSLNAIAEDRFDVKKNKKLDELSDILLLLKRKIPRVLVY